MKRKALIITNPGEIGEENYCEGVNKDKTNYKNFLTSPLGGAWYESEIIIHDRPRCSDIDNYLNNLKNYDYTFIVFSGHGYTLPHEEYPRIELQNNEEIESTKLRLWAKKRTIILDCCRKIPRQLFSEQFAEKAAISKPQLNFEECRRYFDKEIEKCALNVIIAHACSRDEYSYDSSLYGGYYSYNLIKCAKNWHQSQQINTSKQYSCYSIVESHNDTIKYINQLTADNQNPSIDKPRSAPYFPFAIIA